MKRQISTLILLFIVLSASAQISIDSAFRKFTYNSENKIVFEKIIPSELGKNAMFVNAKKWVAINYQDYKRVISMEDETAGTLIYKGVSTLNDGHLPHRFSYTVEMTVKDNKARLRLYDILNLTYSGYPTPIEKTLQVIKDRNKNNPKTSGEFVDQQYKLFSDLLNEIGNNIILKDDF